MSPVNNLEQHECRSRASKAKKIGSTPHPGLSTVSPQEKGTGTPLNPRAIEFVPTCPYLKEVEEKVRIESGGSCGELPSGGQVRGNNPGQRKSRGQSHRRKVVEWLTHDRCRRRGKCDTAWRGPHCSTSEMGRKIDQQYPLGVQSANSRRKGKSKIERSAAHRKASTIDAAMSPVSVSRPPCGERDECDKLEKLPGSTDGHISSGKMTCPLMNLGEQALSTDTQGIDPFPPLSAPSEEESIGFLNALNHMSSTRQLAEQGVQSSLVDYSMLSGRLRQKASHEKADSGNFQEKGVDGGGLQLLVLRGSNSMGEMEWGEGGKSCSIGGGRGSERGVMHSDYSGPTGEKEDDCECQISGHAKEEHGGDSRGRSGTRYGDDQITGVITGTTVLLGDRGGVEQKGSNTSGVVLDRKGETENSFTRNSGVTTVSVSVRARLRERWFRLDASRKAEQQRERTENRLMGIEDHLQRGGLNHSSVVESLVGSLQQMGDNVGMIRNSEGNHLHLFSELSLNEQDLTRVNSLEAAAVEEGGGLAVTGVEMAGATAVKTAGGDTVNTCQESGSSLPSLVCSPDSTLLSTVPTAVDEENNLAAGVQGTIVQSGSIGCKREDRVVAGAITEDGNRSGKIGGDRAASVHDTHKMLDVHLDSMEQGDGNAAGKKDKLRRTPLHLAAEEGDSGCVDLLLKQGTRLDQRDRWRETPLHKAARAGHSGIVRALCSAKMKVNVRNRYRETPLLLAVSAASQESVMALLFHGARLDEPDISGVTPMCLAAMTGQDNLVMVMATSNSAHGMAGRSEPQVLFPTNVAHPPPLQLRRGKKPGWRVLKEVVSAGHLAAGGGGGSGAGNNSSGNVLSPVALSPVHEAAGAGEVDCLSLLLQLGASLDDNDAVRLSDATQFLQASALGHDLWDCGQRAAKIRARKTCAPEGVGVTEVNVGGDTVAGAGDTPLGRSTRGGQLECMKVLLDGGASASKENLKGETPLAIAIHANLPKAVELLLEAGATRIAGWGASCPVASSSRLHVRGGRTSMGRTSVLMSPLELALREGRLECAAALIEAGEHITEKALQTLRLGTLGQGTPARSAKTPPNVRHTSIYAGPVSFRSSAKGAGTPSSLSSSTFAQVATPLCRISSPDLHMSGADFPGLQLDIMRMLPSRVGDVFRLWGCSSRSASVSIGGDGDSGPYKSAGAGEGSDTRYILASMQEKGDQARMGTWAGVGSGPGLVNGLGECDVNLLLDDGTSLPAHACILGAFSGVFRDLFLSSATLALGHPKGDNEEEITQTCDGADVVTPKKTLHGPVDPTTGATTEGEERGDQERGGGEFGEEKIRQETHQAPLNLESGQQIEVGNAAEFEAEAMVGWGQEAGDVWVRQWGSGVVSAILLHVYSGQAPAGGGDELLELMSAAASLQIPRLMRQTEHAIAASGLINRNSVETVMRLAHDLGALDLVSYCTLFLQANGSYKDVMKLRRELGVPGLNSSDVKRGLARLAGTGFLGSGPAYSWCDVRLGARVAEQRQKENGNWVRGGLAIAAGERFGLALRRLGICFNELVPLLLDPIRCASAADITPPERAELLSFAMAEALEAEVEPCGRQKRGLRTAHSGDDKSRFLSTNPIYPCTLVAAISNKFGNEEDGEAEQSTMIAKTTLPTEREGSGTTNTSFTAVEKEKEKKKGHGWNDFTFAPSGSSPGDKNCTIACDTEGGLLVAPLASNFASFSSGIGWLTRTGALADVVLVLPHCNEVKSDGVKRGVAFTGGEEQEIRNLVPEMPHSSRNSCPSTGIASASVTSTAARGTVLGQGVGCHRFPAHSVVLAARSEKFSGMFHFIRQQNGEGGLTNPLGEIGNTGSFLREIELLSPLLTTRSLGLLLKFLYTSVLDPFMQPREMAELALIADEFLIPELTSQTEALLVEYLSAGCDNSVERDGDLGPLAMLQLGLMLGMKALSLAGAEVVLRNVDRVSHSAEFKDSDMTKRELVMMALEVSRPDS